MSEGGIEAKNVSIKRLLSDFYVIPAYQREYVWQSGYPSFTRSEDVDKLLSDAYEAYESNKEAGYFIGSFVVCKLEEAFEVIDGQQRLTTLFTLFSAALHRLERDLNQKEWGFLRDHLEGHIADKDEKDLKLSVQYPDGQETLEAIRFNRDLPAKKDQSSSTKNIVAAFKTCLNFLTDKFGQEPHQVRDFITWLSQKVNVVRIDTGDRTKALKIFETINARGRSLDSMDLLKNLLFRNAKKDQYDELSQHWTSLTHELTDAREKPLRFLRYYLLAKYDAGSVSENSLFDWFDRPENRKIYEANPVRFVQEMKFSALNYISFSKGLNSRKDKLSSLRNLRLLSATAKQHLILLLAAEKMPVDLFKKLCDEVEKTILCFTLARESLDEMDRFFSQWANEVRSISNLAQLDDFVDRRLKPRRQELELRVASALRSLNTTKLTKSRTKYLIVRLANHISLVEGASKHPQDKVDEYMKLQVEHILPQLPSSEAVAEFGEGDQWGEYVGRLGNLTLWDYSENQSVGNAAFSSKRKRYLSSDVLLTRLLALPSDATGVNTRLSKIAEKLKPYEKWDAASLLEREEAMIEVAYAICGLMKSHSES